MDLIGTWFQPGVYNSPSIQNRFNGFSVKPVDVIFAVPILAVLQAPKARNVIAQANGLGNGAGVLLSAEGATLELYELSE